MAPAAPVVRAAAVLTAVALVLVVGRGVLLDTDAHELEELLEQVRPRPRVPGT